MKEKQRCYVKIIVMKKCNSLHDKTQQRVIDTLTGIATGTKIEEILLNVDIISEKVKRKRIFWMNWRIKTHKIVNWRIITT